MTTMVEFLISGSYTTGCVLRIKWSRFSIFLKTGPCWNDVLYVKWISYPKCLLWVYDSLTNQLILAKVSKIFLGTILYFYEFWLRYIKNKCAQFWLVTYDNKCPQFKNNGSFAHKNISIFVKTLSSYSMEGELSKWYNLGYFVVRMLEGWTLIIE